MLLDDGILKIYKIVLQKSETGKPIKKLKYFDKAWYGELNNCISEYYNAKQADIEIELRVRIWQNKKVQTNDIIVIDNIQYKVGRIYHGFDEDDQPITDITLEKVVNNYEFENFL